MRPPTDFLSSFVILDKNFRSRRKLNQGQAKYHRGQENPEEGGITRKWKDGKIRSAGNKRGQASEVKTADYDIWASYSLLVLAEGAEASSSERKGGNV